MKIFVADKISEEGLAVLRQSKKTEVAVQTGLDEQALAAAVADAEALIIRSGAKVTAKVIQGGSNLKVIGRAGVGVDNVDLEAATERGIVVMWLRRNILSACCWPWRATFPPLTTR